MIKVTVLYPNEAGKKFDWDYYTGKHVPMVGQLLESGGLIRGEIDKGISGPDPSAPAPYVALAHLYFNTTDEVHAAFTTHGSQIMGDLPNFTDIQPQVQISEIVA